MANNISSYRIFWAEFIPENGIVTRHDRKAFGDILLSPVRERSHRKCFASKERAIAYIENFSAKLDKTYKVLLFTDKQFGRAKESEGYAIPYTQKQLADVRYVGR